MQLKQEQAKFESGLSYFSFKHHNQAGFQPGFNLHRLTLRLTKATRFSFGQGRARNPHGRNNGQSRVCGTPRAVRAKSFWNLVWNLCVQFWLFEIFLVGRRCGRRLAAGAGMAAAAAGSQGCACGEQTYRGLRLMRVLETVR